MARSTVAHRARCAATRWGNRSHRPCCAWRSRSSKESVFFLERGNEFVRNQHRSPGDVRWARIPHYGWREAYWAGHGRRALLAWSKRGDLFTFDGAPGGHLRLDQGERWTGVGPG